MAVIHPLLERAERVEEIWPPTLVAVIHARHHEETRVLLERTIAARLLRPVLVEAKPSL